MNRTTRQLTNSLRRLKWHFIHDQFAKKQKIRSRQRWLTQQHPDKRQYLENLQAEYRFVQEQVDKSLIPTTMACVLYTEINQAQTLKLQQTNQLETFSQQ